MQMIINSYETHTKKSEMCLEFAERGARICPQARRPQVVLASRQGAGCRAPVRAATLCRLHPNINDRIVNRQVVEDQCQQWVNLVTGLRAIATRRVTRRSSRSDAAIRNGTSFRCKDYERMLCVSGQLNLLKLTRTNLGICHFNDRAQAKQRKHVTLTMKFSSYTHGFCTCAVRS